MNEAGMEILNDFERKADRALELLELIADTQQEMHMRQRKLFKIYSVSAVLVWIIVAIPIAWALFALVQAIF
jgi:hypothetical protein